MTFAHTRQNRPQDKPTERDILLAASRGNLSRYRQSNVWVFVMNSKRINKRRVLDLMRRGLLEPGGQAQPSGIAQRVEITIKGRRAMGDGM
jgi:hypothetical protein